MGETELGDQIVFGHLRERHYEPSMGSAHVLPYRGIHQIPDTIPREHDGTYVDD